MITIKAELESKIFILLIVGIVAIMFGSVASIFIHFDNIFDESDNGVSMLSDDNSNSSYYNSSDYNSNYSSNSYNRTSYNDYDDENATLSDKIKEYLNNLLNNDDK